MEEGEDGRSEGEGGDGRMIGEGMGRGRRELGDFGIYISTDYK